MWRKRSADVWHAQDVIAGLALPEHTVRTYLEQRDVRGILTQVGYVRTACDIGAGFGRLSLVLDEIADHVVAFERESELVQTGSRLVPSATWRQISRLDQLPCPSGFFDLAMVFTVLQHLTDDEAVAVCTEIRRVVTSDGWALLCEESDPDHRWGPVGDRSQIFTIGRSVERYAEMMAPLELVVTTSRRVEPDYPRTNCGTYMLFKNGS